MNNFGVIEVASTRTTNAPGWAYVPDNGPQHSSLQQPTNRKRARNQAANPSHVDVNARQEARIRKELDVLDRDGPRDVHIPIPPKPKSKDGGGSSRAGQNTSKSTPNVRKILQSQKTFANHLDDYLALSETNAGAAAAQKKPETSLRPASKSTGAKQEDTSMADVPAEGVAATEDTLLPVSDRPRPAAHPLDNDPLLVSRVPPMPSDEELRALMSAPPLTYLEARAGWKEEDQKYPVRVFCEVCGYWGRVKCIKCGTRVCALECLDTHKEECVTRYGL
ncbi:uncharacterized protein BCR38DRAFT_428895 [Pseudomassariella vexata]|uniref:HIT-type domain-containing protein n=1 Tax=Pseudomassariella vexata TaxID=1141098 RepID=A0A1Y2E533_9PEZI|nr:uncharacterized protein BCR38DRAFT_428895 [Pseudomassariella vexata]ORY65965.1 hypothetical protein BCR38DRAFT_428895 [Pseudomassariella vexata]